MLFESRIKKKKKKNQINQTDQVQFVLKQIRLGNSQRKKKKNIEHDSLRDSKLKHYAQTFIL